jgi:CBS domain-containing protein
MKKVFDIMTRQVITVSEDDSITTAANYMLANGVSGLPVVDAQNHVIGIITEHDFLTRQRR